MTTAGAASRQRRRDPQLRERIAAAAQTLIAERGVQGLTHRAVATAADVSLSSTTYYFATLDDLIHLALERTVDTYAETQRDFYDHLVGASRDDLITALTDMTMDCFGPHRDHAVLQYELYLAALRRPALRATAARYSDLSITALTRCIAPVTARAVHDLMAGLIMRGLASPHPPDRATVHAEFSTALAGRP